MRWRAGVALLALTVASCGSSDGGGGNADTGPPPVGTPDAVDDGGDGENAPAAAPEPAAIPSALPEAAATTIDRLGSDDAATAATFLAVDGGYDLVQIVDAGPVGRLLADGRVVDDAGNALAPARAPTDLIVDDVTADMQVAGIRSIPQQPLSAVMVRFQEAAEPPGREIVYQRLFLLLALLQQGYSLEQIMNGLFTNGGISSTLELTDENDQVLRPDDEAYESLELTDEDYERALATTSTTPPTTAPKSEEEQRLDELVADAAGVYPIAPDLGIHLQGLGDVISVVPPAGEFVVSPDGTISGSFVYTIVQGVDDARLTSKWDRTLVEAPLELLDDGLTFTAPMDLIITWNESDTQPYVEDVTGILDVELGQLVVTGFTELDSVRFAR